jgi:hypothetical protein
MGLIEKKTRIRKTQKEIIEIENVGRPPEEIEGTISM